MLDRLFDRDGLREAKPSSRLMALPTVRGVASPPATFTTLPAGPRSITSAYASPRSSRCTFGQALPPSPAYTARPFFAA